MKTKYLKMKAKIRQYPGLKSRELDAARARGECPPQQLDDEIRDRFKGDTVRRTHSLWSLTNSLPNYTNF